MSDLWLATILEEYKALRGEVIASITAQQSILSFGTATVALVFGPGLGLWQQSDVSVTVIFNALVPLICASVLVIWWGEVLRMVRAGEWLATVERRVNDYGESKLSWSEDPLMWESYLRPNRDELPYRYYVSRFASYKPPFIRQFVINIRGVLITFWIIALASGALGFFSDYEQDGRIRSSTIWMSVTTGVGMATAGIFMWWRWRSERSWHERLLRDTRRSPQ